MPTQGRDSVKPEFKVMVTTKLFALDSDEPIRMLEEAGCEVARSPFKYPIKPGEMATVIKGVDGLIVGGDVVDRAAIDAADKLKVICMHGIGLDLIDVEYARSKGIVVENLPGINADAVAELALGLLIALARNFVEADRQFREGHWRKQVGQELIGKTVGIVGLGAIGKALARKSRCLGMNVIAYNRSKDDAFVCEYGVRYVEMEELMAKSDFISLHVPHTPETHYIIDAARIALMKKTAYLINTSRGGLIDEDALYIALKEERIAGAALDVFENEPIAGGSPFAELRNCILTPHTGGQTKESNLRSNFASLKKVLDVLIGSRR